ncbi:MAG: Gfo/Idh/MocA family oxidoreductase [Candidatus Hydrogenedentes bacterium]|nr:Gfo/Idh/MocA family oxidoreductase [Candidatus Hydrogenedentota bacterium]
MADQHRRKDLPAASSPQPSLTRRRFIQGGAALAALSAMPIHGQSVKRAVANEKLNMAFIGVGWQGKYNLEVFLQDRDVQVVAVCDVFEEGPYMGRGVAGRETARKMVNDYYEHQGRPEDGCAAYIDFREMLDARDDIDAVVITTPDHIHAVAALAAIEKGKHVFCEKPLAHSLKEVRVMTEAARAAGIATQMGNWGHARDDIRQLCEWIWDDAIGDVKEVHIWTTRPGGWWPYGIDRPEDQPPVPDTLDWDLWLGPAAYRPYHSAYLPFIWRGWWDFGAGALGDMGCHLLDPVVWALRLGRPETVEASSARLPSKATPHAVELPKGTVHPETTTAAALVRWEFPAREGMSPVVVHWYDGGLMPPRPDELKDGRKMGDGDGGVLFVGDKGKLICGCYGSNPQLLPDERMRKYKTPPPTIPRSIGHYKEWVRACKGGEPAAANFDYTGPLTEIVQLGVAAIRSDRKLHWDGDALAFPNAPDAEYLINSHFREGWSL